MATAGERDLEQFGRWYTQAGTPLVEARGVFDAKAGRYSLTLEQSYPEADSSSASDEDARQPLHIPVAMGLLDSEGRDLALQLDGESVPTAPGTRVVELSEARQTFHFCGLREPPTPSLLRGFSAPVRCKMVRSREELAFLMGWDSDAFNRWDAGQQLARDLLLELAAAAARDDDLSLDPIYSEAFGRILGDPRLDGSLKALALTLPDEKVLGQEMDVIDPDALHSAREFMRKALAGAHCEKLREVYTRGQDSGAYSSDKKSIHQRRLKNCALAYWMTLGSEDALEAASAQFEKADNMTDAEAALGVLADTVSPARERALADFYQRHGDDPLLVDKWFAIQAASRRSDTFEQVQNLSGHPAFSLKNPNRLRALLGTFCAGNPVHFNRADGGGYRFLADSVIELDPVNPQVAARMVSIFNPWRRFDANRQALMKQQLERIEKQKGLSKDVFEIVTRALAG